ncbi:MAG: choice-of-anchor L domain-containing protein, partial [Saprospiraceae bacterium]|nr:choice-of-anchor L domain-containing protein [Saprospiraceae bacterium]
MKRHPSSLAILLIASMLRISVLAQQSPAPVQQFEGPDQGTTSIYKAGIAGAVGPSHIVTIRNATGVNDPSIYIYNKTGQLVSTKSFNNYFFSTISGFSDPRIAYDPTQQRWIACATATYNGVKHLCVMHSLSSDPTGAWDALTPILSFFSSMVQPKIGFSNNWIAISCFYEDGYAQGSSITYVWKRPEFYSGSSVSYWTSQAHGMGHLCPVATYDAAVSDLYLVSVNSASSGGKVRVSRIYGNPSGTPQFDMTGVQININNAWSSTGPAAPQSGSATTIALPDHRMASAVYRNGSIWFAHNIFLPSTSPNRALVQWGQVNISSYTLSQLGRIDGGSANLMYAMPSVAVDQSNNVLVGFNKFSSSGYASAAYAYRAATDPLGYMNAVYTYKNGAAAFNQSWGDYSATVIDPSENALWTLQQYAKAGNKWGSQWAKIGGTVTGNCDEPCGNASAEWISGVTVAGQSLPVVNNTTGCFPFYIFDGYYAILKKGLSYPVTLTPAFFGPAQSEYWRIWIDVNHDGDFEDPGELVYNSGSGSSTTVYGSLTIPSSALTGPAVMRVGMRRGSPPPLCGNFSNGQILSYHSVYLIDNDYCDISFYDACTREYIQRVQFNTLNNVSGCGATGYQDFTNISTTVVAGSTYFIQLTPGFVSSSIAERWLVWIDYNKDLDFDDPDELVFDSGSGSASVTNGLISIPVGAQSLTTRMRVKMIPVNVATVSLNACDPVYIANGQYPDQYGEAEDYAINIQGVSIQVDPGGSPESLAQNLLIGGNCYDVSNVTFTGNGSQIGSFSEGLTNIGFDTGIMLATGDVSVAVGPNDMTSATAGFGISTPDADLTQLSGSPANFDMASLEFDITPTQSPLTFQYVFASEEYCEYVGSQFTDAFGLFISGPGISGPFGGARNIATIGSGEYVTINTVNHLNNSGLYVNNIPASGDLCGQTPATGPAVNELQFDGFTRKLTAYADVIPCETYHIKLKICDVGDGIYDSAVFLKAGSFVGGGNASAHWVVDEQPDATEAYEGCSDVKLVFDRLGSNLSQPLTVSFQILGSATQNADYTGIPSSVVIPADLNQLAIPVNILSDLFAEGQETITIRLNNPCSCQNPEVTLNLHDLPGLDAVADTVTICGSGVAVLNVNPFGGLEPYTYQWNYAGNTTSFITPLANVSTNYRVTVTDACGQSVVRTARVIVASPPNAQLIPPAPQICPNSNAHIVVNFNGVGPFSLLYSLNDDPQPEVFDIHDDPFNLSVDQPGLYKILWVIDSNGCIGPGLGALLVMQSNLSLTGSAANIACHGANNGAINTTVSNGLTPYTYAWSQAG